MIRISGYDLPSLLSIFLSLVYTKLFFPKARLIRYPSSFRIMGRLSYGKNLTIGYGARIDVFKSGCLEIGTNVEINDRVHIACSNSITIGDNALIASGVYITDHDHRIPPLGECFARLSLVTAPVSVGRRVWIGQNVSILKGVSICDDCVIGAGSVVTKSIYLPGIYAGIPAKLLRSRSK